MELDYYGIRLLKYMNNNIINYLNDILVRLRIYRNQPYFGPILSANQTSALRRPVMQELISRELKCADSSYKILEVGSWAGESTILWATACKKEKKGTVFVVDHWQGSNSVTKLFYYAKNNDIFNLFLHNIKTSGMEDYIVIMKGSSDTIADILKHDTFDFVYIDGDHAYTQCKKDLLNYKNFVKINGIICGDDLELYKNEIDISNAKIHCEEDYICDTRAHKKFHPGVTLSICEIFGDVSMKEGFWAMRKTEDGWKKMVL